MPYNTKAKAAAYTKAYRAQESAEQRTQRLAAGRVRIRKWREALTPEQKLTYNKKKASYRDTPEKKAKRNAYEVARYRSLPEDKKAAYKARMALWSKAHLVSKCVDAAKHRAAKLKATPRWADNILIKAVYRAAAERGMEVDHIVPLQNKLVCGLHVHYNLQLLTRSENARKGNRLGDI